MKMQEIRTFGRVHGKKISSRQQHLVDNVLPNILPRDINNDNILEIGFGNGEHLRELSKHFSKHNVIGAEPFMNGVASLLSSITSEAENTILDEYKNIQIWPDDVRKILDNSKDEFIDIKFEKIYILHPDPWPKARHEKRRLLSADFLNLITSRLKTGGQIIIGTDHWGYYDWVLLQLDKTNLKIESTDMDIIETRYQKKNKAKTSNPKYLILSVKN